MEVERSGSCHDSQWSGHVTKNRPLSVLADLVIDIGGQQVAVRGGGDSILVEIPSVVMAFRMVRELGSVITARSRLAAMSSSLATLGLTVIVRTPGRRLMTIGQRGHSSLLRLIGFPNAQFHIF